jgi:hypothetical protein
MGRSTTTDPDDAGHRARPRQAPSAQIAEVGVPGVDVRKDRQVSVALAKRLRRNDLTLGLACDGGGCPARRWPRSSARLYRQVTGPHQRLIQGPEHLDHVKMGCRRRVPVGRRSLAPQPRACQHQISRYRAPRTGRWSRGR